MNLSRNLATAWLLVAFAAPSVDASWAKGEIAFMPPAELRGDLDVSMSPSSWVVAYTSKGQGTASLWVETPELRLERVDFSDDSIEYADIDQPVPNSGKEDHFAVGGGGPGTLKISRILENATIAIWPAESSQAKASAMAVRSKVDRVAVSSNLPGGGSLEPWSANDGWPNRFMQRAPGVNHHLTASHLEFVHRGSFFILLSGFEVEVRNQTGIHSVQTGSWKEPAPDDPTGLSGPRYRAHNAALYGRLTGSLHLSYDGPFGHILFGNGSVGGVSQLSAPLANGTFKLADRELEYRNESRLTVEGLFSLDFPRASDTQASALEIGIEGEVSRILQNYVTVASLSPRASVAAVASASLVLLIVYVVVSWARRGAVYVGSKAAFLKWLTFAPLAAKLAPEAVLLNGDRKALLEMLRDQFPYIQLNALQDAAAQRLGISRHMVLKHLRVLYQHNHIDILRPATRSQIYVAINHGLVKQRHAQVAAALLHKPMGLLMAKTFLESAGATQKELSGRVQKHVQISSIGVLKWIRKFEAFEVAPRGATALGVSVSDAGDAAPAQSVRLVRRVREGRVVRYWPTDLLRAVVEAFLERPDSLGKALSEIDKSDWTSSDKSDHDPSIT